MLTEAFLLRIFLTNCLRCKGSGQIPSSTVVRPIAWFNGQPSKLSNQWLASLINPSSMRTSSTIWGDK